MYVGSTIQGDGDCDRKEGKAHDTDWIDSVKKNNWNTVRQEGMMRETGDDVLKTAAMTTKHRQPEVAETRMLRFSL